MSLPEPGAGQGDKGETREQAAAAILPALKYLADEAERAGLNNLADSIDYAIQVAVEAALADAEEAGGP